MGELHDMLIMPQYKGVGEKKKGKYWVKEAVCLYPKLLQAFFPHLGDMNGSLQRRISNLSRVGFGGI